MLPNDLLELRAKTGKSPKEVLYLSNNSTLRRVKLRVQEGWGLLGSSLAKQIKLSYTYVNAILCINT